MTAQLKSLIYILLVCVLVYLGVSLRSGWQAKKDLKAANEQIQLGNEYQEKYDKLLAEKLDTEAKARGKQNEIKQARREAKSEDPEYATHLDRPLPATTRRLFQLASEIDYGRGSTGFDGTDAGADKEDKPALD